VLYVLLAFPSVVLLFTTLYYRSKRKDALSVIQMYVTTVENKKAEIKALKEANKLLLHEAEATDVMDTQDMPDSAVASELSGLWSHHRSIGVY
jgi:hypothetical protein